MFTSFSIKNPADSGNVRFQCHCNQEYTPTPDAGCPACGKLSPRAVSVENGPWTPLHQWKLERLRQMLEPSALDQLPAEHRPSLRANIARQIRQLEDGSWKAEAQKQLQMLRLMLQPASLEKFPAEQREQSRRSFARQIQNLREELEAAGETVEENAPPAPQYFTGEFKRPRITPREWAEDPMHVAQNVASAIALHIQADQMTSAQRHLVFAWLYFHTLKEGGGGFGQMLYNQFIENDPSADMTFEALRAIGNLDHVAVFQKAQERWKSKPRNYPQPPANAGDREQFAAWVSQTFDPLRDEFRDLNEEARKVEPTLESCITTFLRGHQEAFVQIDAKAI